MTDIPTGPDQGTSSRPSSTSSRPSTGGERVPGLEAFMASAQNPNDVMRREKDAIAEAATDLCWKATQFGTTADGDTYAYIVPKGTVHRLVGVLQGAGYSASLRAALDSGPRSTSSRSGTDPGDTPSSPAATTPGEDEARWQDDRCPVHDLGAPSEVATCTCAASPPVPRPDGDDSLRHQRDLLGQALGKLLVAAGATKDQGLTGPQLLLLAEDYTEYLTFREKP